MEIKRAKHSGFCFGVTEAIKKAEETVLENQGKDIKIYTCGSLIHNKSVTDDLKAKGVSNIGGPEDAEEGSVVIIRSHGEPEDFYRKAEEKSLSVVDATCPFVKRIHSLVREAKNNGLNIVVVGDKAHPEVIGINGWCDNEAYIVSGVEEAKEIPVDNLFVVAQTTIRSDLFNEILTYLQDTKEKITVHNTICHATSQRQKSCMETAKESDLMLVIGDKDSSNTKKLYEISKKYCENTNFVENIEYLQLKEI